jgi:O-antigen ligase
MLYLSLGIAAFCVAWLLPGHFFPWTGFQQEVLAAIGAVLLAIGTLRATEDRGFKLPSAATLGFCLALVPMLQWALGLIPFFADALLPTLYLTAFALTAVAARASTESHRTYIIGSLFAAIVVAALASTGIGLAQWLQLGQIAYLEFLPDGGRVFGNFTQPNHLASLLGLGLVAVLWCFETRRIGPLGAALAIAFIGFGAVMTRSRTSWVLALLLALWWLAMRRRLSLRTPGFAVALGLVAFFVATSQWDSLSSALQATEGPAVAERATPGTRPIHWATLWDAAWRRPWLGYGWQQVSVAQQAATLDHLPAHEWITFSHSLVLDLMIWNGAVFGLLLSAMAAYWAIRRLMRCRDVDSWALLAAGGVLIIHALVEFPLAYAYFLLPFGVMVGAVDAFEAKPAERPALQMPRWSFMAVLAALTGMLGWIWTEYLTIEESARAVAFKEAGYVTGGPPPQVPNVVLLDNQREFIWFRLTPAQRGMNEQTMDRMKVLSQRFAPPAAMLRYALVAGLNGREADAARNLALICHMWTARHCDEGRESWQNAQAKYPTLKSIAYPSTPVASAPPLAARAE